LNLSPKWHNSFGIHCTYVHRVRSDYTEYNETRHDGHTHTVVHLVFRVLQVHAGEYQTLMRIARDSIVSIVAQCKDIVLLITKT
jgi:hypothetical protein